MRPIDDDALAESWRCLADGLDDARAALRAGDVGAAGAHVDVALEARRELAAHGETVPSVVRLELYAIRRALAVARARDARRWFGPPKGGQAA